ncbi:MAG: APC family permease [Candidatus Babeliales bacterium]|jgi:amino acid transporter
MEEKGKISLFAAVLISMNIMIGAGIFMNPQPMTMIGGSFGFLGWVFAATLLFPIIWGVARASQIFPGQGGFYNYCKQGINETAGFFASWAYLVGYLGTASTLALFIKSNLVTQFGLVGINQYSIVFNFLLLFVISLLNLLSLNLISKIQSGTTMLKLAPLFFVIIIFALYLGGTVNYDPSSLPSLPLTLPFALFGFWGFESCCVIGHLIKGGQSQVFKAVYIAFFTVAGIYALFHFGVMNIMGVENLKTLGVSAFPKFLGFSPAVTNVIEALVAYAILLSVVNALYGVSLSNITNMFNFAEQGILPGSKHLMKTNRFGRPVPAVFLHGLIVFILITLIPKVEIWASLTGLGVMTAYTLTQVAVLIYDFKNACFGSLFITILGFSSLAVAGYFTWTGLGPDQATRLLYASPILIGLVLGYVMYKLTKTRNAY